MRTPRKFFRIISIGAIPALLCGAMLGAAMPGQSGRRLPSTTQQQQNKNDTIKLRAEEVLLNVTVTDPYGHQATDLAKDEFIVAEDGKRQDIASFDIARVPINVVFLLDASGSVIGELSSLRDAAAEFIRRLGPEDKVSIMEFHSKIELLQDWTSNQDDLAHAISWRFRPGPIPKRGGNTALYDSLYVAADEQLAKVEGRKAIIMLTDGDDTSSKLTYDQGLGAIVRSGAVVYVVSKARLFMEEYRRYPPVVREFERAESVMTDLCTRTGGQIYSPMKDEEMKEVYARVATELKSQYIITYVPKNEERDGNLRHVKVYLIRPGYAARSRDSYYAPKG
jgi:Ca-activated chloride channel family protein